MWFVIFNGEYSNWCLCWSEAVGDLKYGVSVTHSNSNQAASRGGSSWLNATQQHWLSIRYQVSVIQSIDKYFIGGKYLRNLFHFLCSHVGVIRLLKDKCFYLHVSKLFIQEAEELLNAFDDLVCELNELIAHG